ncbi:oligosaccharide flippase family protein [Candidatus Binatia bacterium]|nr:oligosaccharide flippase family protein [Candidatus Binatia bacterium]
MPDSTRQSLLSAGVLSFAAAIWSILLGLLSVPIMVRGLGLTEYGIYGVAFSVAALGSYLDLGLGWTTAKFVAEADAQRDRPLVGTTIAAASVYHLIVGLVFAAVVIVAAGWISRVVLRFDEMNAATATVVLRFSALSFLCSSVSGVFVNTLRGLRRFSIATALGSGTLTLSVGGAAAMAWLGHGAVGAAAAQCGGVAVGLAAGFLACAALLRKQAGWPAFRRQFSSMLGFSLWSYMTRLFQMLMFQGDKILMARWAGAAALPFYSVPFNFSQRVNVIAGAPAVNAIYPIAAVGRFDRDPFIRQYLAGARMVHVLTAAVAIALLLWGDRFLDAWVGAEMAANGTFFLRILTVGFWLVSVGSFDGSCVEGWNQPRVNCLVSAIATATGLLTAMVLGPWVGSAHAIGIAVSIYLGGAGIGQMVVWQRMARYPISFMLWRVALPVLEMVVIGSAFAFVLDALVKSRLAAFAVLAVLAGVLALYGVLRAFSRDEVRALVSRMVAPLRVAA